MSRPIHLPLVSSFLLATVLCTGCTSSGGGGSTVVTTCVVTPQNPWSGDSQLLLVRAVVTRDGAGLEGALVTFSSPTGGQLSGSVMTGADGFAELEATPPFSDASITLTATAQPPDGTAAVSSTCSFSPLEPWTIASSFPAGQTSPDVDFTCELPIVDLDVAVDEVAGAPATVTDQAELLAIRIDWSLPGGGGIPGETVPVGRTVSLDEFVDTVPTTFAIDDLVLLDDAARTTRPFTDVTCGEELDLVAVLDVRVGSPDADGFLSSLVSVPVTLRRDCVPCP